MPGQGLLDLIPSRLVYVYIANLTAKPVNLQKFMIVPLLCSDPSSIFNLGNDQNCKMERESKPHCNVTQLTWYKPLYKKPDKRDEKMERHVAEIQSDRKVNLNWGDELKLPSKYVAYIKLIWRCSCNLNSAWDGHLGFIRAVLRRSELEQSKDRDVDLAPYKAGPQVI